MKGGDGIYLYFACLNVEGCPVVSNKRQNGKTDRAQILCGTLGKVYGCSNLQNWCPKVFDFCKILNIRKLFCFYFYWKIFSQTEALLKVEIENGRKAP